jgi:uncharacterized OB-fold protein
MTAYREGDENCFVVEGKMALPNTYFAGALGSQFIISLRDEHRITGVKCTRCNKVFIPPREYCERCLEKLDENWVSLGNEGTVTTFTVVAYNGRHLPRRAPYVLALIRLDGSDTPLPHLVEGIDPGEMKTGMRVKAVFARETTHTLLDIDHFEPV